MDIDVPNSIPYDLFIIGVVIGGLITILVCLYILGRRCRAARQRKESRRRWGITEATFSDSTHPLNKRPE